MVGGFGPDLGTLGTETEYEGVCIRRGRESWRSDTGEAAGGGGRMTWRSG